MSWNRQKAILTGNAKTRDGRVVVGLKEAVLDGKKVLIGHVSVEKPPFKKNKLIKIESSYWESGGLGIHGDDDLVDA